jgi:hypothetical protein
LLGSRPIEKEAFAMYSAFEKSRKQGVFMFVLMCCLLSLAELAIAGQGPASSDRSPMRAAPFYRA